MDYLVTDRKYMCWKFECCCGVEVDVSYYNHIRCTSQSKSLTLAHHSGSLD